MKLNKKTFVLVSLIFIFTMSFFQSVSATEIDGAESNNEIPNERLLPRFVDDAGLLTQEEGNTLLIQLDELSERHNFDVVIVTVESLGEYTAEEFADDTFDYYGFGMGPDYDGILFLISTEYRDFAISTHGFGIYTFTDSGQDYIISQISDYLKADNFNEAFVTFAELCDNFITMAKAGEPYDTANIPKEPMPMLPRIIFSIAAGCLLGLIPAGKLKKQLKTVNAAKSANVYVRDGSLTVNESRDYFINRSVTKTKIVSESSSGSSTHRSSSGRTHGGSSGKF